jgi:membrane protein required for colicin V production
MARLKPRPFKALLKGSCCGMNIVDIVIVIVLLLSLAAGYRSGLIQSIFSLVGLVLGISIASWNYMRFGDELARLLHSTELAHAIWFCVLALAVMVIAGLIGMLLKGVIHSIGLGWLDRIAGMIFGLIIGAGLVTMMIVAMAAFFPTTSGLGDSHLAKYFSASVEITTSLTPGEMKHKVQEELDFLEEHSPLWLRPK